MNNKVLKLSCFIASKPLQIVNALNVSCSGLKTLLVCAGFYHSDEFIERLRTINYFDEIIKVKGTVDALKYCFKNRRKISCIYTPTDFGLQIGFWLWLLRNKKIMIYEEGLGNYDPDFANPHRIARYVHVLLSLTLDIDLYFGANPNVNGVILYNPKRFLDKYKKYDKTIETFKMNFLSLLQTPIISTLFPHKSFDPYKGKNILLYLTSWSVNPHIEKVIKKYSDYYKIIKPHPHIKELSEISCFDEVLRDPILAEILILDFQKIANRLLIVHENSTAVTYLNNVENIELLDINNYR